MKQYNNFHKHESQDIRQVQSDKFKFNQMDVSFLEQEALKAVNLAVLHPRNFYWL